MRISDDRYDRDRLRFDLALRMMGHGARTRTICEWTGLTDDRLRKLFRAYQIRRAVRRVYRLRAKLPHHASCFLKTSALGFEAATLGSIFSLLSLIPAPAKPERAVAGAGMLHRGEMFCEAYEVYLAVYPSARLSFEHAWYLLNCLSRMDEIRMASCGRCGRLYLSEAARVGLSGCGCGSRRLRLPRRARPPVSAAAAEPTESTAGG